jgi:hypothetical protein
LGGSDSRSADLNTDIVGSDVRGLEAAELWSETVKLPKNLGSILLAVWLILYGLLTAPFLRFGFTYSEHVLALLAMAAGVLLLLER